MRKPIVGVGWKMYMNDMTSAKKLMRDLSVYADKYPDIETFLFPAAMHMQSAYEILGQTHLGFGAQNISEFETGNYTGENSVLLLKSIGGTYAEVGHAERRELFGETDEQVRKKIRLCISNRITPVVCVGESAQSVENGTSRVLLRTQVEHALTGLTVQELVQSILVYEPVWAIGRDKPAAPEYVEDVHRYLRELIRELFAEAADSMRIIYGGSNNPETCRAFIHQPNIDGLFVGRSALQAENFGEILNVVFEEKCRM